MALFGRGRPIDPAWIAKAMAQASELVEAGQVEKARRQYQRIAGQLAEAVDGADSAEAAEPAPCSELGFALLGQADTTLALGHSVAALALYRDALPHLPDPARQLPRPILRQLAADRMTSQDGPVTSVLFFLQATAWSPEPGLEADTAARAMPWLQSQCGSGTPAAQAELTAATLAALPGLDWPVLARTAQLRAEGRAEEAETLLAGAATSGTNEIWLAWGGVLSTLRRHREAVTAFDEALRRGGGSPSPWSRGPRLRAEALLFRGLAWQRLGDHRAAVEDFRDATSEAPNDPRIHYALGRLALQLEADDKAREHFTAALTAQLDYVPARLGIAVLNERAGKHSEAAAHYRAALSQHPQSLPTRVRLGAALLAAGRGDEAEPILQPATGPSFWGQTASFHLGLAQLRAGKPDAALRTWEPLRSPDLSPWLAIARDRIARHELANSPAGARLLWQHAVADDRTNEGYRASLREAALREAALLLVGGRDYADSRAKATAAWELASSLPVGASGTSKSRAAGTVVANEPVDLPSTTSTAADQRVRERRLRALIAMAGGSAVDADDLDASASVRDRCHLAAVALLADQPDRAVALLAPLGSDTDAIAEADPAVARLRALLAEHAEDWPAALAWHQRFLANRVPSALTAATIRFSSTVLVLPRCAAWIGASCTDTATDVCGGCGRESCAKHLYRPDRAQTSRCARCAGPTLRAVLDCARRAGAPDVAEQVLTSWSVAMAGSPVAGVIRRNVALLRAERGDLDGALAELPDDAVRDRAAVLIRRAVLAYTQDDVAGAVRDLRESLGLLPARAEASAAVTILAEQEARLHEAAGRGAEAWDCYLGLLRMDPTDPRRLHATGLAAYRLATVRDDPDSELWQWAIDCLVASLHTTELRDAIADVTGRPADDARFAAARAALIDRLHNDLRAMDRARGLTGDDVDSWSVRLGMEQFRAEGHPQASDAYGPHRYLLHKKRYAAVVTALDALAPEGRDETWSALLWSALTLHAEEHHKNQNWQEAVDCLARAATASPDPLPTALTDIIAEASRRASLDLLRADDDDRQGVVDLMEKAHAAAPDREDVRENLGAAHAQLGRKISNETKDYALALTHIRKALVLSPNDPMAKQFLETVITNRATELTRSDDYGTLVEAAEQWLDLIRMSADPDHRHSYSFVMRLLSRADALADRRASAIDRMLAALDVDPDWSGPDIRQEAARRIAAMVAGHVMDDLQDRPFAERSRLLLTALSYDDTRTNADLRGLLVGVWRAESVRLFDAGLIMDAATLLAVAREITVDPAEAAQLTRELASVYGAAALRLAHGSQFADAENAVMKALQYAPDDPELHRLRQSIQSPR